MNRWKSYMRTAGWRIIWKKIIAVIDATFAVAKRSLKKKIRFVRDSNPCRLRYRCSALTNLTNKPTRSRPLIPLTITSCLKNWNTKVSGTLHTNEFFSYLPNRSQIVPVGTIDSDSDQILRGVSQSSILGPLFFLIYVNDIHNVPVYLISTVLQTIPTFFFTRSKFTFPWVKIKRRIR